jgi:hypothetical protein
MSATTASAAYISGHCDVGAHDRCRGTYAGARCACPHHNEPPPPDPAALYATVVHSAGVASVGYAGKLAQAVCSCGWVANVPQSRNHDAFDDARTHLAATSVEAAA